MNISFGSDNHSGVHPSILAAIAEANTQYYPSYGEDPYTERVQALFKDIFGPSAESFFVFNGTGANVLCLQALTHSFNAIVCADGAHINTDECGAPERHTSCKLLTCPTSDGKLTPTAALRHFHDWGFQHHAQPKVISISQATELGTLYTVDEIRALADLAHQYGMYLHIDGSRLANAAASMNCSLAQISSLAGADAISLGGTKNGMLLGECVILLRPELAKDFAYIRKQTMQLFSKSRFVAAQYLAYFKDGLWKDMASHANNMALYFAQQLEDIPQIHITQKVESNAIFATLPPTTCEQLLKKYCFYIWNEDSCEVRWMCSFNTRKEDIDIFISDLKKYLK